MRNLVQDSEYWERTFGPESEWDRLMHRPVTDQDRKVLVAYSESAAAHMSVDGPDGEELWGHLCAMDAEQRNRVLQRLLNSSELVWRTRHPWTSL